MENRPMARLAKTPQKTAAQGTENKSYLIEPFQKTIWKTSIQQNHILINDYRNHIEINKFFVIFLLRISIMKVNQKWECLLSDCFQCYWMILFTCTYLRSYLSIFFETAHFNSISIIHISCGFYPCTCNEFHIFDFLSKLTFFYIFLFCFKFDCR